jgi:hypothetical protein
VLIATYARRHDIDKQTASLRRATRPEPPKRPTASPVSVTRKVDSSGNVSFAGTNYKAGKQRYRCQVQVFVAPTGPKEAADARGVGAGGTALSGGVRGPQRR